MNIRPLWKIYVNEIVPFYPTRFYICKQIIHTYIQTDRRTYIHAHIYIYPTQKK